MLTRVRSAIRSVPLGILFVATATQAQEPAVCDERAALRIAVTDASGLVAIPQATVIVRWTDAVRRPVRQPAEADGRLFLCAPRDAGTATLWAEFGDASSEQVDVVLGPGTATDVALLISFSEVATGRIVGRMGDLSTGDPVAAATVSVVGQTEVVTTNRRGRFVLSGVPVGEHELSVRRIGYADLQHTVTVNRGITTDVQIDLVPDPLELQPIVASVMRPRRLEIKGFYERRYWSELSGAGVFITAEDIDRRKPARLTHLLGEVPGVRASCNDLRGSRCLLYSSRLSDGFSTEGCQMSVYLNNSPVIRQGSSSSYQDSVNDLVLPAEVAGIEIYSGASELPAEFTGYDSQCGVVVIWTK